MNETSANNVFLVSISHINYKIQEFPTVKQTKEKKTVLVHNNMLVLRFYEFHFVCCYLILSLY